MMKFSSGFRVAAVSGALLLAACASKKQTAEDMPPPPPSSSGSSSGDIGRSNMSNIVPGSAEDLRVNVGDTVHFGYDKYELQDEDRSILQRQAAWLNKYPAVRVTVEGHCDERGTREYNLALGARRANAVKEYLASLGVAASRLDTISYGKERPVCTDSSESCYAQNRRGVTTVTSGASS